MCVLTSHRAACVYLFRACVLSTPSMRAATDPLDAEPKWFDTMCVYVCGRLSVFRMDDVVSCGRPALVCHACGARANASMMLTVS